jgi:hypothetical protein
MHNATHVQGIGNLGPQVDINSASKVGLGTLKLTRTEHGVRGDVGSITFEVPDVQIQMIVYGPEETEFKPELKVKK